MRVGRFWGCCAAQRGASPLAIENIPTRYSAPVSPDLAVRLERAGVSTARLWLSMQSAYDLWQAEHREQPVIERFARID